MDGNSKLEAEFLDRLYAVAMEPERFGELIEVWHRRIHQALAEGRLADEGELRHLESHLGRAETLLDLVTTHEDLLPRALDETIQSSAHPILAIDPQGVVRAQNDAAHRHYGAMIDQSLASLSIDAAARATIAAYAARDEAQDPLAATLVQTYSAVDDRLSLISLSRCRTAGGRRLALAKTIDFSWPQALTPLVREAFGLTEAEAEVMRLLAEGNVAAEIAQQRQAALATVRTQVRSIYEKTGTRNQSEFMRMAIGLSSLDLIDRQVLTGAYQAPSRSEQPAYPRAEDCFMLTLPDGRVLDYAVFGRPDGLPCLYLHNEFFGNVWPAAAVERAEQLGLRIIAPARPCYGRSTCPVDRVLDPVTIAGDLAHLLDKLGIRQVAIICQVAGGITALAMAESHPERVAGLVLVTPLFPSASFTDDGKLPFFHRFLANVTENHPSLLEFVCRSGMAFHNRVGTRNFLGKFAHDHPVDIALLDDPETFVDMVAGVRFCSTNGHRGFFSDYRYMPRDSMTRLLALDLPVIAIAGDGIDPQRHRTVTELVARHPQGEMVVAEGGGHYLHFSHPHLMSETLAMLWERASA